MPLFQWSTVLCVVAGLTVLSGAGLAQKGDLEFGRYLAHGVRDMPSRRDAGQRDSQHLRDGRSRLHQLIKAYRDKRLPNPVMQNIAGRLKDDEIEALAAYFSRPRIHDQGRNHD